MKSERFTEEPTELTPEILENFLEVSVSMGTSSEMIKRTIETGIFLRFIATNDFKVFVAPGSHTHEGILEDNGLDWKDCMITNGVLQEDDEGSLIFIYHSTDRSRLHRAVEKKLLDYLSKLSKIKLGSKRVSSIYSTD